MADIKRINSIKNRLSSAVIHNDTAYLSGQVPWDAQNESIEDQTLDVLTKIDQTLADAGTSKDKLLSATIWLTHMEDFDAFNTVWDRWIPEGCEPSRATVGAPLAQLKNHEFRIEIAVIAAI
ncbi:MAG: hypothetical protein COB76_01070 [Alphaproteobacteria bacterium]|nr:MAG: hypothetical protein COB76_01070 [Alphaproteobacteria bacterium]